EEGAAIEYRVRPGGTGTIYALSQSGTIERALTAIGRASPPETWRAIVGESRPGGEGVETARALAASGWGVTLVSDAACGVLLGEAAVVIVGADSVRADGSLVNKVGTYPLALLAREAGIVVYVVCESCKIAAPGFPLVLEEMNPRELLPEPILGVTARNVYFDHTPSQLITGVVTERGLLDRGAIARLAAEAGVALRHLEAE